MTCGLFLRFTRASFCFTHIFQDALPPGVFCETGNNTQSQCVIIIGGMHYLTKMTLEQKNHDIELRHAGCGYAEIAEHLSLTKDQASGFCRRNYLTVPQASASNGNKPTGQYCPNCGKEISQKTGHKSIRFCSPECRVHWWNSHLDQVQRKANYDFVCPVCKKPFSVYGNANRKYCSHECYIEDRFGGGRR